MAVEEPKVGKVYRVNIYPGCEGEARCHPICPFANGHDWLMLGWLPHPHGPHNLRGMDLSAVEKPIYYLASSELEQWEAQA